jgi:hypothetical protein
LGNIVCDGSIKNWISKLAMPPLADRASGRGQEGLTPPAGRVSVKAIADPIVQRKMETALNRQPTIRGMTAMRKIMIVQNGVCDG